MNPTSKNIVFEPSWNGIRSPWIGTKNIWDLFVATNLFDVDIYNEIKSKKANEWDKEFAEKIYDEMKRNKMFITNLGKCTQIDARPIQNSVYEKYLNLLEKEIEIVNPKVIILFGNQVSTVFLKEKTSVSLCRKKEFTKNVIDTFYNDKKIYMDVSTITKTYLINYAVKKIGSSRVLYGSDFPFSVEKGKRTQNFTENIIRANLTSYECDDLLFKTASNVINESKVLKLTK